MSFPSTSPTLLHLLLLTLSLSTLATTNPFSPRDDSQSPKEYTSASTFKSAILNTTNTYRTQHNATHLTWNDTLAEYAEEWSKDCVFKHSASPHGENLASGYPNATASIHAWGHERTQYPFKKKDAGFDVKTGHFTQLVWKSTTSVGCARMECNGGEAGRDGKRGEQEEENKAPGWFVVCEYDPPGNVLGGFEENVQEQVSGGGGGGEEECPQGAVCPSGAERLGLGFGGSGKVLAIWVAIGVVLCL